MNAIVSVTRDWGIGRDGRLIVPNRADMRRFVELTGHGTVVMGRTTFESLPTGPLKNRRNIVLTRSPEASIPGVEIAHSFDEALAFVGSDDPDAVWLIGGEQVYRGLLGHCARAFVTRHDVSLAADAYFPDLDADEGWFVESVDGSGVTDAGIAYEFVTYASSSTGCV